MKVFKSRFTPNLKNGKDVQFNRDEKVVYDLGKGKTTDIIIKSDYMEHQSGICGYEALFLDDNDMWFANAEDIIDWEGKHDLEK